MRDGGDDNSTFVVDPLVADTVSYDNVRAAASGDGVPVVVSVVEVDDNDVGTDSIDVSVKDDSEDVAVDVAAVVAEDDDDDDRREGSDGVRDVSDDVATDDCARVDDVLPAADDGNDVLILLC